MSQPSVKNFFSTLAPDQYQEELYKNNLSVPLPALPPPTAQEKKVTLNLRVKQNVKAFRNWTKAKKISQGRQDAEGKIIKESKNAFEVLNHTGGGLSSRSLDLASTSNHSRLFTQSLTKRRQIKASINSKELFGEQDVLAKSRNRKNWFHPLLWPAIDSAAKYTNYSPREIVRLFQSRHKDIGLFDALNHSTVNNWINKVANKRRWLPRVRESISHGTC